MNETFQTVLVLTAIGGFVLFTWSVSSSLEKIARDLRYLASRHEAGDGSPAKEKHSA